MAVHVVYARPMTVLNGTVISKETATIAQVAASNTEVRVMADAGIPSSAGNPTIKAYLDAEMVAGFELRHMNNNMIITYDA